MTRIMEEWDLKEFLRGVIPQVDSDTTSEEYLGKRN